MSDYNKTGGPAFPYALTDDTTEVNPGMTLRDYFAAKAMEGYCAKGIPGIDAKIAKMAYEMADAMIAERNRLS